MTGTWKKPVRYSVLAVVVLLGAVYVPELLIERRARDARHSESLPSGETSMCMLVGSDFHHDVLTHPGTSFEATVSIPMDSVGDLAVVDPQMLVAVLAGRTGTDGQLLLVTRVAGALQTSVLYSEPGRDFAGVAFSRAQNRLYVYEFETSAISWAPFQAGQVSLSASDWTVLADAVSVPELAQGRVRSTGRLSVETDGAEPELMLYSHDWWWDTPVVRVTDAATGAQSAVEVPNLGPVLKLASYPAPAATSISVTGPAGVMIEVVRVDVATPIVVGVGQIDATGEISVATTPLQWGEIYGVREPAGALQAPFLSPALIWGKPDTTPIGPILSLRDTTPAQAASLGHDHFQVPLRVDTGDSPTIATYPAYLTVGIMGLSSVTPWPSQANPDRVVLAGVATLPSQLEFEFDDPDFDPIASIKLPLAEDDTPLAGAVLMFQWITVFGPGDLRVSDVVGYVVRDKMWTVPGLEWLLEPLGTPASQGGASAGLSAGGGQPSLSVQLNPSAACIDCLRRCLEACGGGAPPEALNPRLRR